MDFAGTGLLGFSKLGIVHECMQPGQTATERPS